MANIVKSDISEIDLDTGIRTYYEDGSSSKISAGELDLAKRGLLGSQNRVNLLGGNESIMANRRNPGTQPASQPMAGAGPQESIGGGVVGGGGMYANNPAAMPGGAQANGAASSQSGHNPYLGQMGDALTQTMTNNWQRNVQPQIASGAMASGGYGGSRHGVMESNSASDLNMGIGSALSNLYGNGFNTALNHELGMTNSRNSYDLGLRSSDLGFAGLDAQINQNNFNNNLAGANFGMGVWNQGMQNNQTGITAGTKIQNTPMNYWSQFGNQYNSIGNGFGTTTGSTSQQGNPLMGALGGAQMGQQVGNWWGGGSANAAGGANSSGWGTGSGFGNQDYGSFL